jgi:hypothetical protein
MTTPQLLNSIGLVFGMLGAVLLFRFGPPQPNFELGIGLALEDNTPLASGKTVAEHNQAVRLLQARHECLSKVGLALLFAAFAFQLWAVWV